MRTDAPKGTQKPRKNDSRFGPAQILENRGSDPFCLVSDLTAASSSRQFSTDIDQFRDIRQFDLAGICCRSAVRLLRRQSSYWTQEKAPFGATFLNFGNLPRIASKWGELPEYYGGFSLAVATFPFAYSVVQD